MRPERQPAADVTRAAERVGLCTRCAHAAVQRSAKGNAFWRCQAAADHPALLRYPPLPVRTCPAFTEGRPEERGAETDLT